MDDHELPDETTESTAETSFESDADEQDDGDQRPDLTTNLDEIEGLADRVAEHLSGEKPEEDEESASDPHEREATDGGHRPNSPSTATSSSGASTGAGDSGAQGSSVDPSQPTVENQETETDTEVPAHVQPETPSAQFDATDDSDEDDQSSPFADLDDGPNDEPAVAGSSGDDAGADPATDEESASTGDTDDLSAVSSETDTGSQSDTEQGGNEEASLEQFRFPGREGAEETPSSDENGFSLPEGEFQAHKGDETVELAEHEEPDEAELEKLEDARKRRMGPLSRGVRELNTERFRDPEDEEDIEESEDEDSELVTRLRSIVDRF